MKTARQHNAPLVGESEFRPHPPVFEPSKNPHLKKCLFEKRGFEIPLDQWQVLKWLLMRTHGLTIQRFIARAMLAGIRQLVAERAARGKPVPQFIADYLQQQKPE